MKPFVGLVRNTPRNNNLFVPLFIFPKEIVVNRMMSCEVQTGEDENGITKVI
jgi:hypothetical protein